MVCANLWRIYHVTKVVQALKSTSWGWLYNGSWCTDMLCIISLHVWYESCTVSMQHRLHQELRFYIFTLSHNTVRATKNICCLKDEDAIDHTTVTKWVKKFCSTFKNLNNQAKSDRPKNMDSEVVFQAIGANPIWRAFHRQVLFVNFITSAKAYRIAELRLMLNKILQNFWHLSIIHL